MSWRERSPRSTTDVTNTKPSRNCLEAGLVTCHSSHEDASRRRKAASALALAHALATRKTSNGMRALNETNAQGQLAARGMFEASESTTRWRDLVTTTWPPTTASRHRSPSSHPRIDGQRGLYCTASTRALARKSAAAVGRHRSCLLYTS